VLFFLVAVIEQAVALVACHGILESSAHGLGCVLVPLHLVDGVGLALFHVKPLRNDRDQE